MTVWVHIVDGEPVEVRLGGNNVEEEIFQQKVEAHLQDWGWTYEAINELFSAGVFNSSRVKDTDTASEGSLSALDLYGISAAVIQ